MNIIKIALLLFTCFILTHHTDAQQLECKIGIGRSSYLPLKRVDRHIHSDHSSGMAYLLSASYDITTRKKTFVKAGIRIEHYSGTLNAQSNFLGSTENLSAVLGKTLIGFDFTPIRLNVDPIVFELGMNVSVLMHHRMSGIHESSTMGIPQPSYTLSRKDLNTFYTGLHTSIKYNLKLNARYYCFPFLSCYLGLSNELITYPYKLHSLRNHLGIGFGKKI